MMQQEPLDLRSLLAIVTRRRKVVYITFCLAMILAVIINLTPPTYEAKVTLRVKPATRGLSDTTGIAWSLEETKQKMFTFAELIKSRTVLEAAVEKINAADKMRVDYDDLFNKVTVRPLKDTEVLHIFAVAVSPQEAQIIVNSVANAFNDRLRDIVRAESKETRIFIGERLADVKKELEKTERSLVDFQGKNKAIAITEQTRNIVDRQSAIKRMEAENRLAAEAALAKANKPSIIPDTPVIQQYRTRLAEQESELAGLLKTHTPQHPAVTRLQASISENRKKLQSELSRIAKGEVALSETQKATLRGLSIIEEQEMAKIPEKERGLARLLRDYKVAEELYTMLAKRYEEARISEIMESANVQIVDLASLPEDPVKPRKTLNFILAAFLGVFVGTMITFVAEYFHKTIDTAEDVRYYLNQRVIGSIPRRVSESRWKIWNMKTKKV
jgi:uncharacterized protein involved in exopolysaccharide biosynthesis